MLETGFQDPPEEGEAVEPWGVFVGVLKAASLIAAAGKSAVDSEEVYQAGAALARGAPGTSKQKQRKQKQHLQERHLKERHEQEWYEQEQRQQVLEAQRYTKRKHQRDARRMLSACVHARE